MNNALLFLGPIGGPELIMILLVMLLLGAPLVVVFLVLFLVKKSSQPSPQLPPAIPQQSVQDRLRTLEELKDGNMITAEEFEQKRKILVVQL